MIRWGNAKTAALFEDTMVKTAKADQPRVRAQRYPENATQMFVAHMNQCGDEGIRLDAIFPSLVQAVGGFPFHLRHERLGHSTDTVWLVVFETAPELLRFTVGLQHRGNDHRETAFEPVMKSAACVVCHGAHIAADCPELVRARRAELGLEKRAAGYLNKMPEVVV